MSCGIWDTRRQVYDEDSVEASALKASNPSIYGYVYSAEREVPPPEVGWTDKLSGENGQVSLYSENVVKEVNTTESVDRESIANLASTRQQWETIFTSQSPPSETVQQPAKKKGALKWEVRVPYEEKFHTLSNGCGKLEDEVTVYGQTSVTAIIEGNQRVLQPSDMESAIEREIRLAHEREEMLKAEKEERQKLQEKQHRSQGQTIIASFEAVSAESESYQPAYNELTEADRGPDLWVVDARRGRSGRDEMDASSEEENPNESIIEREIRLQNEREAELLKQRQVKKTLSSHAPSQAQTLCSPAPSQAQTLSSPAPSQAQALTQPSVTLPVHESYSERQVTEIYKEVRPRQYGSEPDEKSTNQNDGENLIARELRELREREDDMKRIHSSIRGTSLHDVNSPAIRANELTSKPAQSTQHTSSYIDENANQQRVSPAILSKRNSIDSNSSGNSFQAKSSFEPSPGRNVKIQPLAANNINDYDDDKTNFFLKVGTPIEREMRIARDRENELRRAKGLPEIVTIEEDYFGSYSGNQGPTMEDHTLTTPRGSRQTNNTMRKFASGRLQLELTQQNERETTLRNEGKIISTPQERIEPKKYMEVTGLEKADGTVVRNFVTSKRNSVHYTPVNEIDSNESPNAGKKSGPSIASGGILFSYKESKQSAESKIERELREMREREEELRMQRSGESPR